MTDPLADLMNEVDSRSESSSMAIALAMAAIAVHICRDATASGAGEHPRVPAPRRAPEAIRSTA